MSKIRQTANPRSRIWSIQKKNLVGLVENFFLRTHGYCVNVNFDEINLTNWGRISSILNTLGPPKSAEQWKNSLYFMRNRIRKKVETIEQGGGNPKDNLTDVDYKIYVMLPPNNYVFDTVFDEPNSANENDVPYTDMILKHENVEITEHAYNLVSDSNDIAVDEMDVDVGDLSNNETINLEHEAVGYSSTTLVIDTPEDLESYINDPIIEEVPETFIDYVQSGFENEPLGDFPHYVGATDDDLPPVQHTNIRDTMQLQQTALEKSSLKPAEAAKTSARIPEVQKERLVQLIQNNFLKAVGPFAGANGKQIKAQLWAQFAKELNTLGPPRTAEQWKATFNAIKSGAKAKLADCHNESTKTKNLTRLEEKIVSIYGMDNMDGHQRLGESGFRYANTVPHVEYAESSRNDTNDLEDPEYAEREEDVLRELIEEIRNEPDEPSSQISSLSNTLGTASRGVGVISRPETFTSRTERVITSRAEGANSRPEPNVYQPSSRATSTSFRGITGIRDVGITSRPETDFASRTEGNFTSRTERVFNSRAEGANSRSQPNVSRPSSRASSTSFGAITGIRDVGITSRPETDFASRAEGTFTSRTERVFSSRAEGANSRPEPNVSRPSSRLSSTSHRAITGVRNYGITSHSETGFASLTEGIFTSRTERVSRPEGVGADSSSPGGTVTVDSRPGSVSNSRAVVSSRAVNRPQSSRTTFAPPRVRRMGRSTSPIEYVSNINQFFNDDDDDDEGGLASGRRSNRNGNLNNGTDGRNARDRSNLRNRHTSYGMVQSSISSQERFIEDSNRNHSEMMFLTDRNHVEMVGMFTATLKSLVEVGRDIANKQ